MKRKRDLVSTGNQSMQDFFVTFKLWTRANLEVQFHFAEDQPGQVDTHSKPGDCTDDGPQLEGTLNGIGHGQIDNRVMEILLQLQILQEFRAETGENRHSAGRNTGNQNEVADEG